jgi:8-oxo-dGTP pyrophosphatase MutT (NUDIX family)
VTSLDRLRADPRIARLEKGISAHDPAEVDDPSLRRAAVAILIRLGEGDEPEVFFIQRAVYEGDPWSGQIAFPGGREEPGDESLLQTAMRETFEETQIDLGTCGEYIGALDDLRPMTVRLPAIFVRPFVFFVSDVPELVLSSEVADTFWVPLSLLLDRSVWRVTRIKVIGEEVSRIAFHHRGFVIWGMTERVLTGLLSFVGTAEGTGKSFTTE